MKKGQKINRESKRDKPKMKLDQREYDLINAALKNVAEIKKGGNYRYTHSFDRWLDGD